MDNKGQLLLYLNNSVIIYYFNCPIIPFQLVQLALMMADDLVLQAFVCSADAALSLNYYLCPFSFVLGLNSGENMSALSHN